MKIYNVSAKIYIEDSNDAEEDSYEEDVEVYDEEEDDMILFFQIGAQSLSESYLIADKYLDDAFKDQKSKYEITGVNEISDLNIVNWPEEDCPFCDAETAPPEDVISFDCKCGYNIKVVDGWKQISCPSCDKDIFRNSIIGENGKYIMIGIKED